MKVVIKNVALFVNENSDSPAKVKDLKIMYYKDFITHVFDLIVEEQAKLSAVKYLSEIPIFRLLSEIEFRDPQRLADRLIYSNYN
jgi:hypothetical protein